MTENKPSSVETSLVLLPGALDLNSLMLGALLWEVNFRAKMLSGQQNPLYVCKGQHSEQAPPGKYMGARDLANNLAPDHTRLPKQEPVF